MGTIATATPQIHGSATAKPVATAAHRGPARLDAAVRPARQAGQPGGRSYLVRAGDTLSGIAQRFYGRADDWHGLYAANQSKISDPSLIYVGEELRLPRHLPAGAGYTPRHASSAPAADSGSAADSTTQAAATVGERGYWQINPVNGALSTYDPYGNARAAVIMSADGANWSPWTTYTSGAYAGRC